MLTTLFVAIWSVINRLRGWGNGWGKTEKPVWLVWLQSHIFSRPILSATLAAVCFWYSRSLGFEESAVWGVSAAVFAGWWLGVAPGWGEYFDGSDKVNHEIAWIDRLAPKIAKLIWGKKKPKWAIDSVSFGLRGVYYLPMFAGIAWAAGTPWAMLGALWFWQDAAIYTLCRMHLKGDFVRGAEFISGAFRGLAVASALLIAT